MIFSSKTALKGLLSVLVIFSLFASQSAFAIELNVATMLKNFSKAVPNIMQLVTAFAYVMGFFLVYKGILALKQYGESRSMMSSSHELKGPLLYLFVGAALIYLPSSVQAGLSTFWASPNPYAYLDEGNDPWWELIKSSLLIIELVGTIAFIRGLVLLTHLGGQGGQQGTFGRAMAHLIGGIFCINMYEFLQAIFATFGLGQI